jgi:DNA repair exonuclease SbcCD ATPase subunit
MQLVKTVIENFLSIRKATVLLKDRGLVSIEGKTLDLDGANSNGSGKSTLINAILWCNYDDPGKKLKSVDFVVNSVAGKNCMVACYWYDELAKVHYRVTRYRKHSKFKNAITIELINEAGETIQDLSKGTNDASQALINSILGADKATFEASCFARQENAPDIPGMTDGELKGLLEKVLPFDDFKGLYAKASKNVTDQLKIVADLDRDLDRTNLRMEDARYNIQERLKDIDGWEDHLERRNHQIVNDIEACNEEIITLEAGLKPQAKIDEAIAKYQALVSDYDDYPRQQYLAQSTLLQRKALKAFAESKEVNETCPTCNRDYDNFAQAKKVADDALWNARAEKADHDSKAQSFIDAYGIYTANKEKLDRLLLLNRTQERQLVHIERAKDRRTQLQAQLKETPTNPHEGSLRGLQERLLAFQEEAFNIGANLANEKARLEVLEGVAETYSPKGLRYHILETVTPALNDRTNYYLAQLTDGAMSATWSTVTKLKSGDYKEAFSVDVKGKRFNGYGSLSGGEKRKVKLACFFALQDLIASRATKSISLWCGDEIDHALDPAGLERLMSVLHEKTKTKSTILVISHNELREWIPNFTTVVKEDGISTITGYLSDD